MRDDPDTNVQFVKMIERNPCVYNRKSRDISNKAEQDETWAKIGMEFDATVAECKERWKNLRACFTRHLKLIATPGYSSIDKKPYYLAEHLNFLKPFTKSRTQFYNINKPKQSSSLRHHELHEKEENLSETEQHCNDFTTIDDDNDANIQDSSDTNLTQTDPRLWSAIGAKPTTTTISNKRHWVDLEEANLGILESFPKRRQLSDAYDEDLDLCFFKSLLPDIRQMNPDQKRRFKVGIINLSGTILNEEVASFPDYHNIKREFQVTESQNNMTFVNNTNYQKSRNHPKSTLRSQTQKTLFPLLISKESNKCMVQEELNAASNFQGHLEYQNIESRPESVQSTLSSDSSIEFKLTTDDLAPLFQAK